MVETPPLHEHGNTHLWPGTFSELAAENISPEADTILIVAESESKATTLRENITANLQSPTKRYLIHADLQEQLPWNPDIVDTTILSNPSQNPFRYHQPLYQATAVTKQNGTIIYQAPQRLAHSRAVQVEEIYAVGWENHCDPSLAALMTVTEQGAVSQQTSNTDTQKNSTISAYL